MLVQAMAGASKIRGRTRAGEGEKGKKQKRGWARSKRVGLMVLKEKTPAESGEGVSFSSWGRDPQFAAQVIRQHVVDGFVSSAECNQRRLPQATLGIANAGEPSCLLHFDLHLSRSDSSTHRRWDRWGCRMGLFALC